MKFDDSTPKELEELLNIAKRRKAQICSEYNAALDKFLTAMGGNSSIETRQELGDKADSIKAELNKTIAGIEWLENRLGANYAQFSQPNTSPSTTAKNAATATTASVQVSATESVAETSRRFQHNAGKILNLLKVQITPSTVCVEPNDSVIKAIFSNQGKKINVTEKHKSKKKNAVVSNIEVQGDTPLDEHDRAVLGVIVSEQNIGNHYTTVNIIHRALIGKPAKGADSIKPSKDQRNAIINSAKKLMGTVIDFTGVNDSLKAMKYTDKAGNELFFKVENLLSAGILDAKVNGQPVEDVIYFKDSCPLFDIANLKDQVIRYPHELLNVPNQNNTPLVISLKKYVMRRICEIKLHSKQLAPTITFDDLFSKCNVNADDKSARQDARNVIIKFLDHLKAQNFISDFQVRKEGGKFSKFELSFDPQKEEHG